MTRFLWGRRGLFGELPPDALERAKENLSRLWFVGRGDVWTTPSSARGEARRGRPMPYRSRGVDERGPAEDGVVAELVSPEPRNSTRPRALPLRSRSASRRPHRARTSSSETQTSLRRCSIEPIAPGKRNRRLRRLLGRCQDSRSSPAASARLAAKNETRAAKRARQGDSGADL